MSEDFGSCNEWNKRVAATDSSQRGRRPERALFCFCGAGGGGAVVATAQAIPTVNSQCFKAPLGN